MKQVYEKILIPCFLIFSFASNAQDILLNNDFGTDQQSLNEATAGWGVAELDTDGQSWQPYLDPAFEDAGFTGIVNASASFTVDDQGNTSMAFPQNLIASPEVDLSGYSNIQLTFRIGAIMEGNAAMAYGVFVVGDTFIDFYSPNLSGVVTEPGSEVITMDLTGYAGQSVTLMWMHQSFMTYGNGYLVLDDIVLTGTTTAGITEVIHPKIAVYPNPATDRVTVSGLPEGTPVSLYNSSGQKLLDAAANGDTPIDISSLASGIYFLHTAKGAAKIVKK